MGGNGFWYLASPYSKYHSGLGVAFDRACRQAALLIEAGIPVFCPIAHSHPIADWCRADARDHETWMRVDRPMMEAAHGLIVCKMVGWAESKGVSEERRIFEEAGKPIVYIEPGVVPEELSEPRGTVLIDGEEIPVSSVEFSWVGPLDFAEWSESRHERTKRQATAQAKSILAEAESLVSGKRQRDYAPPRENLGRIASIWSVLLEHEVTPEDVARCMIAVKLARDCATAKRDNAVDIAGYAQVLDMVRETRDE